MVSLRRFGFLHSRRNLTGTTTESINGKKEKINWHFGVAGSAGLEPIPHFRIFYSLVFTDKNYKRMDKEQQRKLRRSIPREWYNRKWFETLLAAMLNISPSPDANEILISIDHAEVMRVSNQPFSGLSETGYFEPKIDR